MRCSCLTLRLRCPTSSDWRLTPAKRTFTAGWCGETTENSSFADTAAFEPEIVTVMSKALTEACIALQVLGDDEHRAVAALIIDLAKNGVVDAIDLRDTVLMEANRLR